MPVGFFDSGLGGISVARAFLRLRPQTDVRYVADWQHCPYGEKPDAEILERARAIAADLVAQGCRLIVVACNTASAVALTTLRHEFPDTTFVGMEPAIKPAAALARERAATSGGTPTVGVLATAHTLGGSLFRETARRCAEGVRIIPAEGKGFVELAENPSVPRETALATIRRALDPLLAERCDPIVLGCTHYPFLLPLLRECAPGVTFLDPAEAVARRAASLYDEMA